MLSKITVILPPRFPCLPFLTWLVNNYTIKNGVCVKRKKSSSSKETSAEKPLSNDEKFFPMVSLTNVAVTGRKLPLSK